MGKISSFGQSAMGLSLEGLVLSEGLQNAAIAASMRYEIPAKWATFEGFCSDLQILDGGSYKPMVPFDWQLEFSDLVLREWGERKSYVFCKSRQCAATTTLLVIVLWISMVAGTSIAPQFGQGLQFLFLSRTKLDAWELSRRLRSMAYSLHYKLASDSLHLAVFGHSQCAIHFRGCASVDSAGRGLPGITGVIVDEASFISNCAEVMEAVAPATSTVKNAKTFFLSTPNGKTGFYWGALCSGIGEQKLEAKLTGIREQKDEPFQIVNSPITKVILHWRAIPAFCSEDDFLGRMATVNNLSPETVSQEYDLKFSQKATAVFDYEMVQSCIDKGRGFVEYDEQCWYFMGVDTALMGADAFAIIVLEFNRFTGKYRVVFFKENRRKTMSKRLEILGEVIENYRLDSGSNGVIGIESNQSGQLYLESLAASYPGADLQGVSNNKVSKPILIQRLSHALESEILTFPMCDLVDQLFTYEQNDKGQFSAPHGGRDDAVIALAIALAVSELGDPLATGQANHTASQQVIAELSEAIEKLNSSVRAE